MQAPRRGGKGEAVDGLGRAGVYPVSRGGPDLHVLGAADGSLALLPAALQSPLQALNGVQQPLPAV